MSEIEDTPAPEPSASAGELHAVLAGLPEEQREVLMLRFADDLELSEIAESMGIPLGTVKSRLHHGLRTLREDARTKEFFNR
jgi:RNA polymerase sigma-70 factor (ECF subfamily)